MEQNKNTNPLIYKESSFQQKEVVQVSIVVPLLNEEKSLPELVDWIKKVCKENHLTYEVLFVDDGSKDNSWAAIKKISGDNANIKGIRFQRNYGKSAALNEGFKAALGQVVITMDADLQDNPEEIPGLYKMIEKENYDLVSGWKKIRHDNKMTKNIPSRFFNAVTRSLTGIHLHDFNCGLKAYKKEVVKNIEVYGEMHRYIPVLAKNAGFTKIGEKIVHHQARKYGSSKFGLNRFINGFLDLLTVQFMGRFGKKPMHFFGLLGSVLFIVGFIISAYMIIAKLVLPEFYLSSRPSFIVAMDCIIVGIMFFLAGFLGELVVRNAPERNHYFIKEKIKL